MLDTIFSGQADGSYLKKLTMYIKPNIPILDDWGMAAFSNQYLNILNEIISIFFDALVKSSFYPLFVIPAQAGIQGFSNAMDSSVRGSDGILTF